MVGASVRLNNFHAFLLTQFSKYLSYICPYVSVDYLSTIFRRKYNMVLTSPFGMF